MPARSVLAATAALVIALPALAQDRPQPPAPQPAAPAPSPAPSTTPQALAATTATQPSAPSTATQSARPERSAEGEDLARPVEGFSGRPPVELPDHARRDPQLVGRLDPVELGLGAEPWRGASGAFLSTLMRRMETPIASRWAHIALRNLAFSRAEAPRNVHVVDWTAERAWLLLRMGEADAARMLIAGVDVDRFTPKMFQIAVQSALASADPSALCPLQEGIAEVEQQILQLVDAMCAALAGEPETASAQIDAARRRGRTSAIDLDLAQKVVGATGSAGRAVTIEWEPVEQLNAWRFGLATATGMIPPARLIGSAPPRVRAWQARAPLLAPQDRLPSARIAAGLGVFSSQSMIDLHSLIYDSTGPDDIPETEAWQLRQAFVGSDQEARLSAMRRLWRAAEGPLEATAARAMLGRAAARIAPDPALEADAANLIASMLAAGYDRQAAAWGSAVERMDGDYADEAWAMLALAAPDGSPIDVSAGRIGAFIDRDDSPTRKRSALLLAGLTALGRVDAQTAERLNSRYGLRLGRTSRWTRMIDRAAVYGQSGTVLVLTATGLQAAGFEGVPPAHLLHSIAALRRTGQDFTARMIAAEALART